MRISQRSGRFELEMWTDGYPEWTSIHTHEGEQREEVLRMIHPDELPDLHWALGRMIEKLAAEKAKRA
jgi:hypothetical protein